METKSRDLTGIELTLVIGLAVAFSTAITMIAKQSDNHVFAFLVTIVLTALLVKMSKTLIRKGWIK